MHPLAKALSCQYKTYLSLQKLALHLFLRFRRLQLPTVIIKLEFAAEVYNSYMEAF